MALYFIALHRCCSFLQTEGQTPHQQKKKEREDGRKRKEGRKRGRKEGRNEGRTDSKDSLYYTSLRWTGDVPATPLRPACISLSKVGRTK